MRRIALVTGAARGIGYGIACALAGEGCDIAVCDVQEQDAVAPALAALRQRGAEVLYCRADVAQAGDRARLLTSIRETFGRLNVLVNNAGVAPKTRADILEASEESFDRVLSVNLKGPCFLTQAAARWMIEQKQADADFRACIINISSISATVASPSRGEYCISKAGVSMATKLFAARLGPHDIPVYEIRPGIIRTDMTAPVADRYDRLIFEQDLLPQRRWGLPEDVGRAAAALVRGDLAYSTGQVLMVDGGFHVQRL